MASAPAPSEYVDPQNPYPMITYAENTLAYPSALRLGMTLLISFPDLHLGFPHLQNYLGLTWPLISERIPAFSGPWMHPQALKLGPKSWW